MELILYYKIWYYKTKTKKRRGREERYIRKISWILFFSLYSCCPCPWFCRGGERYLTSRLGPRDSLVIHLFFYETHEAVRLTKISAAKNVVRGGWRAITLFGNKVGTYKVHNVLHPSWKKAMRIWLWWAVRDSPINI